MTDEEAIKKIDSIYEEAMNKLDVIAQRHKAEIDAYITELKEERVRQLERELKS